MPPTVERIGIIGNGAVGMLMASFLKCNYDVTLYGRVDEETIISINRSGVTTDCVDVLLAPIESLEENDHDVFFVTTKSHQVKDATRQLSGNVPVFICSNGIAHLDYAKSRGFHLGVIEHGVSRDGNRIQHNGLGRVRIGSVNGLAPVDFIDSLLNIVWERNIEQVVIEKLFANAIINPITALCRVANGELKVSPYRDMAISIYEEMLLLFDYQVPYTYIEEIIEKTALNRSSMLRDIEAGRPTEVQAILTPLIALAEQKGQKLCVIPLLEKLIIGVNTSC